MSSIERSLRLSVGSYSTDGISGGSSGLSLFQGFACPKQSRKASLNWRRILVLRRAASVILARALRSAVFNDSARSGGSSSDAVPSAGPPSFLGSLRSVGACQMDSRDSSGSGVVVGSLSTEGRDISRSGVPPARLLVRRLGRGLGGSSRRGSCFRPLVSRGSGIVHKHQRAPGRRSRSSVLCSADYELHGGLVRRQFHSDSVPSQPRRHSISTPQLHRPAHTQMSRVASSGVGSTIYYGAKQCSG